MQIAIVGAGIAGLTCARQLVAKGHTVTLFEKSRGVSGRMATRETELGGFDHGAQYFTATSEAFKNEVVAWRKAGWVVAWDGKLVALDNGEIKKPGSNAERSRQRYVAAPGMSALGQQLAAGLDVRTEQLVTGLVREGAQWRLQLDGAAAPALFDAVLVAVPANQAQALLQVAPAFAAQAAGAHMAPCWALLLGFQQPLELGYEGAWVDNSRLGWIALDASKAQRRPGEHWVAHATRAWSEEHLEDDDERVREKLLKAFHEATGSQVQPVYVGVHRWRFAQATQPLAGDCMWDPALRIGACGDWFAAGLDGGGRVENAFLSAIAVSAAVS